MEAQLIRKYLTFNWILIGIMITIAVIMWTIVIPQMWQLLERTEELRIDVNESYQDVVKKFVTSSTWCPLIEEQMAGSKKDIDDFWTSNLERQLEQSNYDLLLEKHEAYCQ